MTVGPLELLVLGFEGNRFTGEIAPAIEEAVNSGAIRVIDLIFASKDPDGTITAFELEDADDAYARDFGRLSGDLRDILTEDEAITVAEMLPPNTSAIVALIEHLWSTRIAEAIRNANGQLLASQRISPQLIEQARGQLDEVMAAAPTRSRQ